MSGTSGRNRTQGCIALSAQSFHALAAPEKIGEFQQAEAFGGEYAVAGTSIDDLQEVIRDAKIFIVHGEGYCFLAYGGFFRS